MNHGWRFNMNDVFIAEKLSIVCQRWVPPEPEAPAALMPQAPSRPKLLMGILFRQPGVYYQENPSKKGPTSKEARWATCSSDLDGSEQSGEISK